RFRSASRAMDVALDAGVAVRAYSIADDLLSRAATARLELTTVGDAHYPPQLLQLHDPPPVLWSRGDWATLSEPVVAIVGTRHARDRRRPRSPRCLHRERHGPRHRRERAPLRARLGRTNRRGPRHRCRPVVSACPRGVTPGDCAARPALVGASARGEIRSGI